AACGLTRGHQSELQPKSKRFRRHWRVDITKRSARGNACDTAELRSPRSACRTKWIERCSLHCRRIRSAESSGGRRRALFSGHESDTSYVCVLKFQFPEWRLHSLVAESCHGQRGHMFWRLWWTELPQC